MAAPYLAAHAGPRLGSEAGAAGPAGVHVRPSDPRHWRPSAYDWGTAAGAAAVGGMAGSSYYPQSQSSPPPMPNCTDELQQEQGPYYNRIGQRRFCY